MLAKRVNRRWVDFYKYKRKNMYSEGMLALLSNLESFHLQRTLHVD